MAGEQDYINSNLDPLITKYDELITSCQTQIDFWEGIDTSTVTTRDQLAALHTAQFGTQDAENGENYELMLYNTWLASDYDELDEDRVWTPDPTHADANKDGGRYESVAHYCARKATRYTTEKAELISKRDLCIAKKEVYLEIEAGTWDGTPYPTPA
jgi:hypothetical protein